MKRKLLCVVLSTAMLSTVLTGCGGNDNSDTSTDKKTETSTNTKTEVTENGGYLTAAQVKYIT